MPQAAFYDGLALSQKLQKFLDHHSAPQNRHISSFEATMLSEAIARLDQTIRAATKDALTEFEATWRSVEQRYQTTIYAGDVAVEVVSIPRWQLRVEVDAFRTIGFDELKREARAADVQVALAALLLGSDAAAFRGAFNRLSASPSEVEALLEPAILRLLNHLLYQPSVPVEMSPPVVDGLVAAVLKALPGAPSTTVFVGSMVTGHPLLAFSGAGGVILLQVVSPIVAGMQDNLRAFGDWLTHRLPGPQSSSPPGINPP